MTSPHKGTSEDNQEGSGSRSCPVCGRQVLPAASTFPGKGATPNPSPEGVGAGPLFPFCSPRCRMVDLGRWLNGEYVIPGEPLKPPESGDAEAP